MNGGVQHVVLADANGLVWDWGENTSGQLGNHSLVPRSVPQHVRLPKRVKQVAAGQKYSLALSSDGAQVYAWGDNSRGQLGIGTSAVSMADAPLQVYISLPANQTITSIADGGKGAFAVLSNGRVMGWGANQDGQAGQGASSLGDTTVFTPERIAHLSHVVSIAAGDHQTLALKSDGTVWAWGDNRYGQLGPNGPTSSKNAAADAPVQVTGLPPIVAVAAGGEDSLALDAQGNIWSWGRNGFGQLGWGGIDPLDGRHPTPTEVVGVSNIVSIDGEGPATLAADASGDVYAWGFNRHGEVGDGTTVSTGTPQRILELPVSADALGPSVQVSAGHWFSYAFNAVTGEIAAWGRDNYGELAAAPNNQANDRPTDLGDLIGSQTHDTTITSGDIYALYKAILGDLPDASALHQWRAAGTSLKGIAEDLIGSPDYSALHGSQTNAEFVRTLLDGATGMSEGASGSHYIHELDHGVSRATIGVKISESGAAAVHFVPPIW